jgi:hypothetical protein
MGASTNDWDEHVTKLLHENRFHHEYRMSLEAFNQLLELLRSSITVSAVKSKMQVLVYTAQISMMFILS